MGLPFHILDVFTTGRPMSGNQLLVVEDHEDTLSTAAMQQIATEIGFAESAFVRKPTNGCVSEVRYCAATVRIFTIDEEVPQAGHPIIGLNDVIGSGLEANEFAMMTSKGPISVRRGAAANEWFASQDACDWLGTASAASVADLQATGRSAPLATKGVTYPIGSTCGLPYVLVPVDSEQILDDLAMDPAAPPTAFQAQCDLPNGLALYFYVRTGDDTARTRMFCHEGGPQTTR
jgi:PhzF family phenazine biosynthesis protein